MCLGSGKPEISELGVVTGSGQHGRGRAGRQGRSWLSTCDSREAGTLPQAERREAIPEGRRSQKGRCGRERLECLKIEGEVPGEEWAHLGTGYHVIPHDWEPVSLLRSLRVNVSKRKKA